VHTGAITQTGPKEEEEEEEEEEEKEEEEEVTKQHLPASA
jgi:hypothetical protein